MNRETLRDAARDYLAKGFSVLPLDAAKSPTVRTWKPYQAEAMTPEAVDEVFRGEDTQGLGIVCGRVSGSLEVIDVDTKHDSTGTLWEDFSGLIRAELPELYGKLLIAKTRSGGRHIYYRAELIQGNKKLAKDGSTKEVLIETRGEGGYVVAVPSIGYELEQGSYDSLPTLTAEERELLHLIARGFDTTAPELKAPTAPKQKKTYSEGLTPWEDYDARGDVIELLQKWGWKVTHSRGSRIYVLRPGHTDSKTSGDFHEGLRTFKVWSSSTAFESEKGYSPSAVYAVLECGGDFAEAARKLRADGYGDRQQRSEDRRRDSMENHYPLIPRPDNVSTEGLRVDLETREGESLTLRSTEPLTTQRIEKERPYRAKLYYTASTEPDNVREAVKLLLGLPSVSVLVCEVRDLETLEGRTDEAESSGPVFLYDSIRDQYEGELTAAQEQQLQDELVTASFSIRNPLHLDRFINEFKRDEDLQEALGISPESWEKTVARLRKEQRSKEREAELRTLTLHVRDLTEQGQTGDAVEALRSGLSRLDTEEGSELVPAFKDWHTLRGEIAAEEPGLSTGYEDLDEFVSFKPGTLTLVGGRPSHGKTALLLNLCLNIARAERPKKGPVYFFTYEEPSKNLAVKFFNILHGQELRYPGTNYANLKDYIRNPERYRASQQELETAEAQLQELIDSRAVVLVDAARYAAEDLAALVTYQAKEENVRAVLVDYVQRMRANTKTQDIRTKVGHISDVLLRTAIETEVPFIVGAQMNRDGAGREPSLENLKETGNLEEDANTVLSVFNWHREETDPIRRDELSKERKVNLVIRALKNREGEVNRAAELELDKWTQRISNGAGPKARRGF